MKDSIKIIRTVNNQYTIQRTLEETVDLNHIKERINAIDRDLEIYHDKVEDLETNLEKRMKERAESVKADIKEYKEAIKMLDGNRSALFDALQKGKGSATSKTDGNTAQGGR